MNKRKYNIYVNFYKPSGKWYASCPVEVTHQLFEMDELKQDIVNNQDVLVEGWQGDYIVTIDQIASHDPFFTHLFTLDAFIDVRNTSKTKI